MKNETIFKQILPPKLILCALLAIFLLSAASVPAVCAEIELNQQLEIDGYRILRSNESTKLHEGYEVTLKGFGTDTVLVEFYNNNTNQKLIGSVVIREGETVQCYRVSENNSSLVLMMTLDKMYINNSQIIAGFSHIYQYSDPYAWRNHPDVPWKLETSILDDPSIPTPPLPENDKNDKNREDLIENPRYTIIAISIAALAVVIIALIFKKRIEKR
jgi:hypothetical protein